MVFVKVLAVLMLAAVAVLIFTLLYEIIICPVKPGKGERVQAVLRVSGSAPCLENTLRKYHYQYHARKSVLPST